MKILIAEDSQSVRQMIVTLLVRRGFICDAVDNGRKAVEAWERQEYDLILMDVQMPVLSGLEAARMIREKQVVRGGHVPIIALTAHAMAEDRQQCLDAGMDNYLSKPIDLVKLFSLLSCEP